MFVERTTKVGRLQRLCSLKVGKASFTHWSGPEENPASGNIRTTCTYRSIIVRKTTKKIVPTTPITIKMESHSSQVIS
jgi:hypothetical protein